MLAENASTLYTAALDIVVSSKEVHVVNAALLILVVFLLVTLIAWQPVTDNLLSPIPVQEDLVKLQNDGRPLPGPWSLPLLGNLPQLGNAPFLQMTAWRHKYGDCFLIRMGSRPCVVVNSIELMREACLRQGTTFSGRPDFATFQIINDGKSVAFATYSASWKIHQKIMRNSLKLFTSGHISNKFQSHVSATANQLANGLLAQENKPFDPLPQIRAALCTVLYSLCFGLHPAEEQAEERAELANIFQLFGETQMNARGVDVMPWTKRLMGDALAKVQDGMKNISDFVNKRLAEHSDWHQHVAVPRDLMDALINEAEKLEERRKQEAESGSISNGVRELTAKEIVESIDDIFAAGMETTTNFIQWALLYMVMYPETQRKVQEEIDLQIREEQQNLRGERINLPYTEACILEICRHGMFAPLTLPHCTTADTILNGYRIPKDTLVFFNQHAISRDENLWTEPEQFRPERFLTETGAVDRTKAENVVLFGMGNRRCLGEQLGRIEMFCFFTSLLRRCHFKPSPNYTYKLEGFMGFTWYPKPYPLIVERREGQQ